ncbi:MAG TPA: nitrite reductase, partial [Candidatus Eisenbacteria bacterium]|nr:nitrite reductase [Candidatus Eisenbacteria bacterium]
MQTVTLHRQPPEAAPPGPGRARASWHLRANAVVVAYLAATVVAVLAHDLLPVPRWLAVHLLMLGAVTNAIVTWSEHFAVALLRAPAPSRRRSAARLVVLNAAVVGVLAGVTTATAPLVLAAACTLLLVVVEHVVGLVRIGRRAMSGRFARTVRFYVVAGVALVVGIALGAHLAVTSGGDDAGHARVHAAHVHTNLLGWVGLSVLGTLFTLWPTVLRTRIVDGVERAARTCLLLTAGGLAVAVTGFLLGSRPAAAAGLVVYAGGVAAALGPFVRTWRQRAPHDAASWTLAAGV